MRTFLVLASLLTLAACSGDTYKCQPICKDPNSATVVGSDVTFNIGADSAEDAELSCKEDAMNTPDVCMPGWTVMRCSCSS